MNGRINSAIGKVSLFLGLALLGLATARAADNGWPRTIPLEQGSVAIYAPQVDEREGDLIRFRAALAWRPSGSAEPVFGAGWFESETVLDRFSGTVHLTDTRIVDARFPEDAPDVRSQLAEALAQPGSAWSLDFPEEQLETSLRSARAERDAAENLNTAPPDIIYRDRPAILVTLDGDPILRTIENSSLQAVINTPYPLIYDGRRYYLNVAQDAWYRADRATGPYRFDARPPREVAAMVDAADSGAGEDSASERIGVANAPEIVVSTRPAELVVTEGPAAFVPVTMLPFLERDPSVWPL